MLYAEPGSRLLLHAPPAIGLVLALGMLTFSAGHPAMLVLGPWIALCAAYWLLVCWVTLAFQPFDLAAHDALVAEGRAWAQPSVDVFLPNCGEPLDLLANTFSCVAALRHAGPLRVLCLDDAGRPGVAVLAEQFGFEYLARPNQRDMAKAGNLRYAYLRTGGDFIAVFDADFCPRPDFLGELLPYALRDPQVGIVQSPQFFKVERGHNWVQNGAATVQESFYRVFMRCREIRRSSVCVGTNAIYRRRALERTDGPALVKFSEDVHTGFDLLCVGYRTLYVPVILAAGACPDSVDSLRSQQYRWCRGSTSLFASRKFWQAHLGLKTRLTFITGFMFFLQSSLGAVAAPLPALVMVWVYPHRFHWWSCLLFIPIIHQALSFFGYGHQTPNALSGMRSTRLSAWAHLLAMRDLVFDRAADWAPTRATERFQTRRRSIVVLAVSWGLLCGSALLVGAIARMPGPLAVNFWPIIVFAGINIVTSLGMLVPLRSPVDQSAIGGRSHDLGTAADTAPSLA